MSWTYKYLSNYPDQSDNKSPDGKVAIYVQESSYRATIFMYQAGVCLQGIYSENYYEQDCSNDFYRFCIFDDAGLVHLIVKNLMIVKPKPIWKPFVR